MVSSLLRYRIILFYRGVSIYESSSENYTYEYLRTDVSEYRKSNKRDLLLAANRPVAFANEI